MKRIGSVNACNIAYLLNKEGVRIGETLDTPNAVACAMANHPDINIAYANYQYFGVTKYYREELKDRFKSSKNDPVLLSFLKIYEL